MKIISRIVIAITLSTLLFGCKSADKNPPITEVKPPQETSAITPIKTLPTSLSSEAQEIINRAFDNTFNAKSFDAEMIINADMMGMKMQFSFEIKKYESIYYLSGEVMGMSFESYLDGKNVVMKEPMGQKWQRLPQDEENPLFSFEQMQKKLYLKGIQNPKLLPDEKIQDKIYYLISASLDPKVFMDFIGKQGLAPMELEEGSFSTLSVRIWIGKDDLYLYKTNLLLEATLDMGVGEPSDPEEDQKEIEEEDIEEETEPPGDKTPASGKGIMKAKYEIEVIYSDYNKATPIVIPPEAKNALEEPEKSRRR
jgi:hypothetical protein